MNIYAKTSIIWVIGMTVLVFIRLRMNRGKPEKEREYDIVPIVMALVIGLFLVNFYQVITPEPINEEWRVFETYQSKGLTFVLTYGHGKRAFKGIYEFQEGVTYNVTWKFPRLPVKQSKYGVDVFLLDGFVVEVD